MKRKALTSPIYLLFLLWIVVFLTSCRKNCFVGNRAAGMGSYRLDVDNMTGIDSLTMEMKAGDTLEVYFEALKGSMYMEIREPDKTILYAGNGKVVTEFSINISESGTYSIYLEAHRAKGTVHIQQIDG